MTPNQFKIQNDGSYNLDVYRKETPEAPHSPVPFAEDLCKHLQPGPFDKPEPGDDAAAV